MSFLYYYYDCKRPCSQAVKMTINYCTCKFIYNSDFKLVVSYKKRQTFSINNCEYWSSYKTFSYSLKTIIGLA